MELTKTKELMEQLKSDKYLGTYAVQVYLKGDKGFISSQDAGENTYFDVASMGKVLVTTTLILEACDMGMMNIDMTLGDFFDEVPDDKKNITVKQMLTHSSGIRRVEIPDRISDSGREAVIWYILKAELAFEPGKAYLYSCNAFILLGFILEKIFGMTLDKIYEKYITKPLGLNRSKFNIALDEPDAAVCYRWKYPGKYRVDDQNVYTLHGVAGNGASQSCANDIGIFSKAVLDRDERLYSREYFDLAEHNYTPELSESRGLGYLYVDERYKQTGKLFPTGSFGHCGHSGQCFFINRELDMYVVILTNATRYLNMKSGFNGYDYGIVCKMRENMHNAVYEDLKSL